MGQLIPQRPRPIRPDDLMTEFRCGEESLERYLADRGLANHVADVSRCYVTTDAETGMILGYYTLSAVGIARAALAGRVRRNAPDPIPAVLLGRLAVATESQGRGLGGFLLRDAILSTLAAAEHIGARVLLVHALHPAAAAFYRNFGFQASPTDPLHLYVLLADARRSLHR